MTMGAGILCRVRRAPLSTTGPAGDARKQFDLMRSRLKGRPAESPASGEWFCSRHFERKRRRYRVTAQWIWANEEPARRDVEPLLWENPSGCASPNRKTVIPAARSKTSRFPF